LVLGRDFQGFNPGSRIKNTFGSNGLWQHKPQERRKRLRQ
jgi:hypothetical protein